MTDAAQDSVACAKREVGFVTADRDLSPGVTEGIDVLESDSVSGLRLGGRCQ